MSEREQRRAERQRRRAERAQEPAGIPRFQFETEGSASLQTAAERIAAMFGSGEVWTVPSNFIVDRIPGFIPGGGVILSVPSAAYMDWQQEFTGGEGMVPVQMAVMRMHAPHEGAIVSVNMTIEDARDLIGVLQVVIAAAVTLPGGTKPTQPSPPLTVVDEAVRGEWPDQAS